MGLGRLGCHNAVELRVLREVILEWQDDVSVKQQAFTFAALRDI